MIRNETEYQEASERLDSGAATARRARGKAEGGRPGEEEIKRVIDPLESFHLQLKEEVESYEKLKRGEFGELDNLRGLGHLLISIRIAQGLSQRDLAKRLNVHESQVSRDERNEYFGITLERAIRLLDALNVKMHTKVEDHQRPGSCGGLIHQPFVRAVSLSIWKSPSMRPNACVAPARSLSRPSALIFLRFFAPLVQPGRRWQPPWTACPACVNCDRSCGTQKCLGLHEASNFGPSEIAGENGLHHGAVYTSQAGYAMN